MTRSRFPALVIAVALLLTACSGGGDLARVDSPTRPGADTPNDPDTDDSSGDLVWSRCETELPAAAGLDCATLDVPLDPTDPDGETIELALARQEATGSPDERIGSLLFNPGGPGGSGLDALAGITTKIPEELAERFDLVAWDPRGVGESSPVECLDDAGKDAQLEGDLSPDTPEEFDDAVSDQQELREACEVNNSEVIAHMSTADVAADLDEIRQALGDDQLNYVGFSYGTAIGATYATLFPDKVRAMVLDGSVSPGATDLAMAVQQAQGFESTYLTFLSTCDASPECALAGGAGAKVDAVRQRLDAAPLAVDTPAGERQLTRDLFDIGLLTALYDTSLWGTLARAIADIDGTGGATMLSFADTQVGRNPDGTWSTSSDVNMMVNCADSDERPTAEQAEADVSQLTASAPTFGPAVSTSSLACVDWPLAANPTPAFTGAGSAPILVIGTVGDPATPFAWSEEMAGTLESATLLTYEGSGHTAFLRGGPCIDDAVTRYLVDLTMPAAGTRCAANTEAISFGGVRQLFLDELTGAGVPEDIAVCITDGLVEELGEAGLEQLLLSQDVDEQTRLITQLTTRCMTGGG